MTSLGSLDTPASGEVVVDRVHVAGWVVAPWGAGVVVLADGLPVAVASTGHPRPDVAAAVVEARGDAGRGWEAQLDLGGRPPGAVTVTAIAVEPDGTVTTLNGAATVTVEPAEVGWPAGREGNLDEPVDAATFDELGLWVRGWAPPLDGGLARIEVLVGGEVVGLARPFQPRPDVAGLVAHPYAAVSGFDFLLEVDHLASAGCSVAARAVGWAGTSKLLGPVHVRPSTGPARAPGPAVALVAASTHALARRTRRPPRPGRVALVGHNLGIGGAQRWFGELALGLAGRGQHEVVVLAGGGGPWEERLGRAGLPAHLLAPVPLTDGERYEHRIAELCSMLAGLEPEVVLVNTRSLFPIVDAAHRLGLPVVWGVHESTSLAEFWSSVPRDERDHHVIGRLEAALQAADHVVCGADFTAGANGIAGDGRAVTVPYGVDLAAIDRSRAEVDRAEARRQLRVDADAELVVWLATYSHRKGQLSLVEVARRLRERHPSLVVALVGRTDNPVTNAYADAVHRYVDEVGLAGVVRCVPAVVDEPWAWLSAADLFVCASDAETLPYAILEAMAAKVAVVSTAVAGIPDVVVPGRTGWLVEPRDVGALAAAVAAALDDEVGRRTVAAEARALVEGRHAFSAWLDAMASLLTL